MPATSAAPTLFDELVDAVAAALPGVQVGHGWAGPETEGEGIWLGDVQATGGIATLKAGRRARDEVVVVTVHIQTFTQADASSDARAARARWYELFAGVENACADDAQLGGVGQWLQVVTHRCSIKPYSGGWAAAGEAVLQNTARLT